MSDATCEVALEYRSFAFGDVEVRFETNDRTIIALLDRRYHRFRSGGAAPDFTFRFESTTTTPPNDLASPLAVKLEALDCTPTAAGYRVVTETTRTDVDVETRRAVLRGPSVMYPIDNVLRHVLPLVWDEGVMVHAGAFLDEQRRGFLAAGPSGAGKSTLCRLAGESALSDELVAVRLEPAKSVVVSLPFWEARPGRADLHAILLLRHGERHRLERLGPQAAFRELVTQILWPVWSESAMARAFGHLARLVEETPAYRLWFRPEPSVFDFVHEEVP